MKQLTLLTLIIGLFLTACEQDYTPKPRAYPRMSLPTPNYISTDGFEWSCPFYMEYSDQSRITVDPRYENRPCWYNIYYPKLRATLHLTYNSLDGENDVLAHNIEESRKLAMKHIAKATKIDEILIDDQERDVHGIVYDFQGETASDLQFFLTDSTQHFLRGALYFNVAPNKDSLAPAIEYVKQDIQHIVASLQWDSSS